MNQKELTKTFMMVSNCKKLLFSMIYTKVFQRCKYVKCKLYVICDLDINREKGELCDSDVVKSSN